MLWASKSHGIESTSRHPTWSEVRILAHAHHPISKRLWVLEAQLPALEAAALQNDPVVVPHGITLRTHRVPGRSDADMKPTMSQVTLG
jgi:hypothetical protein